MTGHNTKKGLDAADWAGYTNGMTPEEIGEALVENLPGRYFSELPLDLVADLSDKLGIIISKDEDMGSDLGPFSPEFISGDDIRSIDPRFPSSVRVAAFFSTDHSSGAGGVYLYLCTGDLAAQSDWISYTDAVSFGMFDYLSAKPVSNPIFIDSEYGDQTETPCVNIVNGEFYMTYQNRAAASYESGSVQQTCLAISSDCINFNREFISKNADQNGVLLTYDPRYFVGDGHTGYFSWSENPIKSIPEKYIGYSLHGGSVWPYAAQWVSDDAIDWSVRAVLQWPKGSITADVGDGDYVVRPMINPKNIKPSGDGYRVITHANRYLTSGTDFKLSIPVEIFLNSDGSSFTSKAAQLLELGGEGSYDEAGSGIPTLYRDGLDEYVFYYSTDADQNNVIAASLLKYKNGSIPPVSLSSLGTSLPLKMLYSLPSVVSESGTASLDYGYDGIVATIDAGNSYTLSLPSVTVDKSVSYGFEFEFKQNDEIDVSYSFRLDFGGGNYLLAETFIYGGNPYMKTSHFVGSSEISSETVVEMIGYGSSYIDDGDESVEAFRRYGIVVNGSDMRAYLTSFGVERQRFDQSFLMPSGSSVTASFTATNEDAVSSDVIIKQIDYGDSSAISNITDFDDVDANHRYFYRQDADLLEVIDFLAEGVVSSTASISFSFNVSDSANKEFSAGSDGSYIRIRDNGGLRVTDGSTFINVGSGYNDGNTHDVVININIGVDTTITIDGVETSHSALSAFALSRLFAQLTDGNKCAGYFFDVSISIDGSDFYTDRIDGAGEPDQYGDCIVSGFKRSSAYLFEYDGSNWVSEDVGDAL